MVGAQPDQPCRPWFWQLAIVCGKSDVVISAPQLSLISPRVPPGCRRAAAAAAAPAASAVLMTYMFLPSCTLHVLLPHLTQAVSRQSVLIATRPPARSQEHRLASPQVRLNWSTALSGGLTTGPAGHGGGAVRARDWAPAWELLAACCAAYICSILNRAGQAAEPAPPAPQSQGLPPPLPGRRPASVRLPLPFSHATLLLAPCTPQ